MESGARSVARSTIYSSRAAADRVSALRALSIRSMTRARSAATAGADLSEGRVTRAPDFVADLVESGPRVTRPSEFNSATNRALSVSSNGCRLGQMMAGINLSWPQCFSTSTSTASASQPSIFREAITTWSCTSADGSLVSLTIVSRRTGAIFPKLPAARTAQARNVGSSFASRR